MDQGSELRPYRIAFALTLQELEDLASAGVKWLAMPGQPGLGPGAVIFDGDQALFRAKVDSSSLRLGYAVGCFPYPDQQRPGVELTAEAEYYWHRPNPRTVFDLSDYRLPSTLRRCLPGSRVTVNQAFDECIAACAEIARAGHVSKPWLTQRLLQAYRGLYRSGDAFSVEVWNEAGTKLLAGLFGVTIGHYVSVESMFRRPNGSSKPAFATLLTIAQAENLPLVDVQLPADHWFEWGAISLPRAEFAALVPDLTNAPALPWARWAETFTATRRPE
jgi:leucyl/phenylalanyl-tRNA--protein transferase